MSNTNNPKTSNNGNQWTVLVYMASDNTLSEESAWALTEMRAVKLEEGVNVITLFDSDARGVPTLIFPLTAPGQGFVGNGKKNAPLILAGEKFSAPGKKLKPATVLPSGDTQPAKFEEISSAADARVLKGFLKKVWQDSDYKAPHNMLILSGHGSGAIGDFLTGDDPPLAMSIPRVGKVIQDVLGMKKVLKNIPTGKIDILGMDSCLMSMVEICFELTGKVDFLVGAEGFEPETGWPYQLVLQEVNGASKFESNTIAQDVACRIAESYVQYYQDYVIAGISVDQAVCDLRQDPKSGSGKMADLVAAISELATALRQEIDTPAIQDLLVLAHWKAQSYKSEQYLDLWDFCEILRVSCEKNFPTVRKACKAVQTAIKGTTKKPGVVVCSHYYGTDAQHSHGVSIYFPWKDSAELDAYQKLPFSEATKWGEFLRDYVRATQRKVRGEERFTRNADGEITDATILELYITSAASPLLPSANSPGGIKTPPDTGKTPPDTGKTPPDTGKHKFALRSNMKNSPTSFLVKKDSGESIQ